MAVTPNIVVCPTLISMDFAFDSFSSFVKHSTYFTDRVLISLRTIAVYWASWFGCRFHLVLNSFFVGLLHRREVDYQRDRPLNGCRAAKLISETVFKSAFTKHLSELIVPLSIWKFKLWAISRLFHKFHLDPNYHLKGQNCYLHLKSSLQEYLVSRFQLLRMQRPAHLL